MLFKKVSKYWLHASSAQRSSPSLTSVVPTGKRTSFRIVLHFKRKTTLSWFHPRWIKKSVFTGFCAASEVLVFFLNAFFLAAGLKNEAGSVSYHKIKAAHSCHI